MNSLIYQATIFIKTFQTTGPPVPGSSTFSFPEPVSADGAIDIAEDIPGPGVSVTASAVPPSSHPRVDSGSSQRPPTTPVSSSPSGLSGDDLSGILPAKRTFDSLHTLFEEDGLLHRIPTNGQPCECFGPASDQHYQAYLISNYRYDDVLYTNKTPQEPDTSDSDWEDSPPQLAGDNKQGMSRAELKALDREIPWRKVLDMSPEHLEAFRQSVKKEYNSWLEWESVKPLSRAEADRVLKDKILAKRVLRSRSCFRDKAKGLGELKAKCRVVALGHRDPDVFHLNRECVTPNRTSEHVLFLVMVAGYNKESSNTGLAWKAWMGDAATAFLQGEQGAERSLPLYLRPPNDEVTRSTGCWDAPLYLVQTNIYGLANAPRLWSLTVIKRLKELGFIQHSFDKMVFLLYDDNQELCALIVVYVDDFFGIYRVDFDNSKVECAFKWGSFSNFEVNKTLTFKGKQLTLRQKTNGRHYLEVNQAEFIDGLETSKIPRGSDLASKLSAAQRAEFRSITGSLQWLCSQSRPELSAANSLANKGEATTVGDLKSLLEALDYAKSTRSQGFIIEDVALNRGSVIVSYADSSWANAEQCRSQFGVLVVVTTPAALQREAPAAIMDWKSGRSTRVCRSTLAAEASAADEGCDRGCYLNRFISQLLYNIPAHRCQEYLHHLHVTDAKSLYDCVVSESPNVSDKRSLVNIRAIQEVVDGQRIHWVPTSLQWADGLTKSSPDLRATFRKWLQKPRVILRGGMPKPKENNTGENVEHATD